MHSYQPSAEDILRIANCDLFLYVGGESDKWVDKALKEGGNPKRRVLNLMKLMGNRAKVEEEVEGMEKHDHHDHDKDAHAHPKKDKQDEKHEHHDKDKHDEKHEHEKEHDKDKHDGKVHHEKPEYDEHVWLSLKTQALSAKLSQRNWLRWIRKTRKRIVQIIRPIAKSWRHWTQNIKKQ